MNCDVDVESKCDVHSETVCSNNLAEFEQRLRDYNLNERYQIMDF